MCIILHGVRMVLFAGYYCNTTTTANSGEQIVLYVISIPALFCIYVGVMIDCTLNLRLHISYWW